VADVLVVGLVVPLSVLDAQRDAVADTVVEADTLGHAEEVRSTVAERLIVGDAHAVAVAHGVAVRVPDPVEVPVAAPEAVARPVKLAVPVQEALPDDVGVAVSVLAEREETEEVVAVGDAAAEAEGREEGDGAFVMPGQFADTDVPGALAPGQEANKVPGAPGDVAHVDPAAPPETKNLLLSVMPPAREEQYTAIRPPPPAPPELAFPLPFWQPSFAAPPFAVTRPAIDDTVPARMYTEPPAPLPPFVNWRLYQE
jgi:hypothetical protein